MSQHLSRQLALLREKILHISACVEKAISQAITALIHRDQQLAANVIADDDIIDRLEVEVEEECLKTLALYQPVANDLRLVVSLLKINNDLERMGDLAKNIAKRAAYLAGYSPCEFTDDIRTMAGKAQLMVKRSLDALVDGDAALARRVRDDDDEVDALHKRVKAMVYRHLRESPEEAERWLKWSSVAKHIERLADMATHIAEDVIYMAEGEIVRHRPED
jgi:phosphate transport system protein